MNNYSYLYGYDTTSALKKINVFENPVMQGMKFCEQEN
jgi:hypothetical protein